MSLHSSAGGFDLDNLIISLFPLYDDDTKMIVTAPPCWSYRGGGGGGSCISVMTVNPLVSHAAGGRRWPSAQSLCPSDTQTGSSRTATAATESKWRSRNTWQQSLGKGIDRELETKDAGWHICSILPLPTSEKKKKKKLKCVQPHMKSFWDLNNQWIAFVFLNMYLCMK